MRILAIDQGTTSTRGLIFADETPPRFVAAIRHKQHYPQPGWVEHDPLEILANVKACIAAAGQVDAIGIANQGESCLAWDATTLKPLSPIIVWQDRRTDDSIQRLKAEGAEAQVAALSGLPLDCYFSATKLAWLLEHNPDARSAWRAGRLRLGTTDTFLLETLAGTHATDPTTASRTGLMNIAGCNWDEALCNMFGVPIECLAPIRPSTGPFGKIDGTPLLASIVDQQAALFGHGCRQAGDAKITFGTGAFALALGGNRPIADAGRLTSTVAWQTDTETRYAVEGGVYDAGAAVEWAMRIGLLDDPAELHAFDEPPAISRGLAFIPALSGLACPQWDRGATGLWIGMTTATTRRDLQQAILEGVALQTCEVVAELQARVGLGDVLCVDGGLSASDYFLHFLASASGKTIVRSANTELSAYGCALLCGLARPAAGADGERFEPARYDKSLEWVEHYRQACGFSASWNHGF